jgi:hypothetical protein
MEQMEGNHRRVTGLRNGNGTRGVTGVRHRGTGRAHGIWGEPKLDGVQLRAMAVEFPVVQIQTELLRAGVLTVDEVREMRGLPKLEASTSAAETEVAS